jgi:hypothetical protein
VIVFDNLATVHDRHVDRKIGVLSDMTAADSALRIILEIQTLQRLMASTILSC